MPGDRKKDKTGLSRKEYEKELRRSPVNELVQAVFNGVRFLSHPVTR